MADGIQLPADVSTLAFVGTAKNSGKTTTLNWMLSRTLADATTVGLVSIGVDGEEVDAVADLAKPRIRLPAGHWIATAADAFERSTARFDFVRQLEMSTPLGDVFVAQTREPGDVLLAGMRHRSDLLAARDQLAACGADVVFIDGAYGRSVAADGRVAEAVILATGAAVGRTPEQVVDASRPAIERLQLTAPPSDALVALGQRAVALGRVIARADGKRHELPETSALQGLETVRERYGDALDALAIPGAVTDRVVDELLAFSPEPRTLLVASPTALQLGPDAWSRLTASPWRVCTLHPVRLLGITANPAGPQGAQLDSTQLVRALRDAFPGVAVVDPSLLPHLVASHAKTRES